MLRIIGFERGACGCLVCRYQNEATDQEMVCVEEPAVACRRHRRHDLLGERWRTLPAAGQRARQAPRAAAHGSGA